MPGWRSQWRLVLLNCLTCGLEICLATGIAYVPPLLLEAGVEERYMTMVLGKFLVENNKKKTKKLKGRLGEGHLTLYISEWRSGVFLLLCRHPPAHRDGFSARWTLLELVFQPDRFLLIGAIQSISLMYTAASSSV